MGYSITIGNAELHWPTDEEYDYIRVEVKGFSVPDAPTAPNDDMTGTTSERSPSYIGWGDFCDATGLRALFFDDDSGLMREHPGAQRLLPKHHDEVRAALDRWQQRFPNATPRFAGRPALDAERFIPEATIEDAHLARLRWLDFWIGWALEHCERPAIGNT